MTLDSCTIQSNQVLSGSNLVQMQNEITLNIINSTLMNNLASEGTHGIKVVPDYSIAGTTL